MIVEFNGKRIGDERPSEDGKAATPPGKKVSVKVVRDGKETELYLTLKKKRRPGRRNSRSGFERVKATKWRRLAGGIKSYLYISDGVGRLEFMSVLP